MNSKDRRLQLSVVAAIIANHLARRRQSREEAAKKAMLRFTEVMVAEMRKAFERDPRGSLNVEYFFWDHPRITLKPAVYEAAKKAATKRVPEAQKRAPEAVYYSLSFCNQQVSGTEEEIGIVRQIDVAIGLSILNGDFADVQALLAKLA